MRGRREERIEQVIDHAAALGLAAAVGTSANFGLTGRIAGPKVLLTSLALAILAYLIGVRILRRVTARTPVFAIQIFELPVLDTAEELILTDADRYDPPIDELVLTDADRLPPRAEELVLTDADRLRQAVSELVLDDRNAVDELVLDDILAELGPDSRVVRLFDPSAMPTPGQLNARIEQHLRGEPSAPPAPADASQALYEALSELRRSLR